MNFGTFYFDKYDTSSYCIGQCYHFQMIRACGFSEEKQSEVFWRITGPGVYPWPILACSSFTSPPLLSKTENRALYKQCADQSWNVQSSSKHLKSQKTLNQKEQIFKGFSSMEKLLVGILSDIFQSGSNMPGKFQTLEYILTTTLLLASKTVPPDIFECFATFVISPQARICSSSAGWSWDQNLWWWMTKFTWGGCMLRVLMTIWWWYDGNDCQPELLGGWRLRVIAMRATQSRKIVATTPPTWL